MSPRPTCELVQNGDCPMFGRFYVQKVLCSENICLKGSMFRRFYIQKVLCSEGLMFRRFYIQKVLCSEGPMFKNICSKGPIFRRSYVQKVLYSECSLFDVGKNLHLLDSGKLQCKITNHSLSISSFGHMSFCHGGLVVCRLSVHNLPKSLMGLQSTQTRSDHRSIVLAIQEYDTIYI